MMILHIHIYASYRIYIASLLLYILDFRQSALDYLYVQFATCFDDQPNTFCRINLDS